MKIVIDIPDRILCGVKSGITRNGSVASRIVLDAVKNGKVLPKGHGRLIDADALKTSYGLECATKYGNKSKEQQAHSYDTMMMYEIADMLDCAPTIIEADKEAEE